jgi:asparagine synthase (glutamine-hydrolysing)
MCGIVGYTGSDLNIVKRAHALQAHRGPDDVGFYSDEDISLGHNRLAIIDLNPRAAQPMWDTAHRYSIVFNGEIYNYQELKTTHLSDYSFQTESDTEVILALFAKFGTELTRYLRGMYAFVIYDTVEKNVYLFRDEFGIKPLFYATGDFGVCFASELKSVVSMLKDNNHPLTISEQGLSEYQILGYTIAPTTLYNEIKILEHGHHITFSILDAKKSHHKNTMTTVESNLDKVLEKVVIENTVADVPVGIFFSGGVDSSLITGILKRAGKNLKTFTLNVAGRNEDAIYSDKIAKQLHISPYTYTFDTKQFDESYKDIINSVDHPAGSTSLFQTHFIAKETVKEVKVALMGDGGDELFYGYPRSLILHSLKSQRPEDGQWLEKIFFILPSFRAKNLLFSNIFRVCGFSVSYYLLTMTTDRHGMGYENWRRVKSVMCTTMGKPEDLDRDFYLTNDLLYKSDYATSFCALEGRVPLASSAILINSRTASNQSFATKVPKYYLKLLLEKLLPRELIERKKSGFGINYRSIVTNSNFLRDDFAWAVAYLQKKTTAQFNTFEFYQKHNAQHVIAIVTLAKALSNNERIYNQR